MARKKTKRLHWFNFGLHSGLISLHEGLHGAHHRLALVCMAGRVGRIGGESASRRFFVGCRKIIYFKRLQIAVICVYLRKNSRL